MNLHETTYEVHNKTAIGLKLFIQLVGPVCSGHLLDHAKLLLYGVACIVID